MADTPLVWNLGESILVDLFVVDPSTGLSLTGQASFITLTIQRLSDNNYWSGLAWVSSLSFVSFTEVDSANQPGRYLYTLPPGANVSADRYVMHSFVNNPPTIVADTYEIHVSRNLTLNVYSIEAVDP